MYTHINFSNYYVLHYAYAYSTILLTRHRAGIHSPQAKSSLQGVHTMNYNKSEIMKRAWTLYKNKNRLILEQLAGTRKDSPLYPLIKKNVPPFADSLKQAWADAKREVTKARAVASLSVADKTKLAGAFLFS